MRGILIAFALLALSGCVSDEEAMMQDHGFCYGIGAKGDTYAQCMMQRQNGRAVEKQARNEAIARFGADLQRQQEQQQMINAMNRPKMTTCNQFGRQINCTTF